MSQHPAPRVKSGGPKRRTAEIIAAAAKVFARRGYHGASTQDIADVLGIRQASLYYYFESKEAIVLAFYDRAYGELGPMLEEAQTGKKLDARMEGLITAKFRYFEPNRRFLGALMGHAADPASPLSPFGEPSKAIRESEIGHFGGGGPCSAFAEAAVDVPNGTGFVLDV